MGELMLRLASCRREKGDAGVERPVAAVWSLACNEQREFSASEDEAQDDSRPLRGDLKWDSVAEPPVD